MKKLTPKQVAGIIGILLSLLAGAGYELRGEVGEYACAVCEQSLATDGGTP